MVKSEEYKLKQYKIKNDKYNEIQKYMSDHQYQIAHDLLLKFIDEYPCDIYGQFDYARCLIKLEKEEEAIDLLEYLKSENSKIKNKIFSFLFNHYLALNRIEDCERLLESVEHELKNKFDIDMIKLRYYYTIGNIENGDKVLKQIKPQTSKEKSVLYMFKLHNADSKYFRQNKEEIERKLNYYLESKYISRDAANDIFVQLYRACYDNEKAYKYLNINKITSVKGLIYAYEVCMELGKEEEANKYLKKINTMNQKRISKTSRVQILYYNNKKEEAFELCKTLAVNNYDAAYMLYNYSIKMCKTEEAIDVLKQYIINNPKTKNNSKNYDSITQKIIRLLIYQRRYEEAYYMFIENKESLPRTESYETCIFLSKKLNIPYKEVEYMHSYYIEQIKQYDYELACENIIRHKYSDDTKIIHSVFKDDIQVHELIKLVTPYLIQKNLIDVGIVDKYEIDCKDLDINETRLVVVTIGGEKDILSCYPSQKYISNLENSKESLQTGEKTKQLQIQNV